MMSDLPQRQRLYHQPPEWVDEDAVYFMTVGCASRGVSQPDQTAPFEVMVRAIDCYEASGKWRMMIFLTMPDHRHEMVQFPKPENMEKILRDWKRYVAKRAGIVWQDGFFEHRLRSRQSAEEKWHYIRQNPVRKSLVDLPEKWRFVRYANETAR